MPHAAVAGVAPLRASAVASPNPRTRVRVRALRSDGALLDSSTGVTTIGGVPCPSLLQRPVTRHVTCAAFSGTTRADTDQSGIGNFIQRKLSGKTHAEQQVVIRNLEESIAGWFNEQKMKERREFQPPFVRVKSEPKPEPKITRTEENVRFLAKLKGPLGGRIPTPESTTDDSETSDDDGLVAGQNTKNAILFVSLIAAAASLGYLVKLVAGATGNFTTHAGMSGLVDVCYNVVFVDAWAKIAITVLVLYTRAVRRFTELVVGTLAAFTQPNEVNSLWFLSLAMKRSITAISVIGRNVVWWLLGNQLWGLIPLGKELLTFDPGSAVAGGITSATGRNQINALLTTLFDLNGDGIVTTTEVQMWFVAKTLRLLWFFIFIDCAKWLMTLKQAPTRQEMRSQKVKSFDDDDFLSQILRTHFAGLRGDKGIDWDTQARSALIDKTATYLIYLSTAYWCLTALGVNMNGLLAVGGVSGIAVGFAAQKLVSNCIGGILIFVTQPFVEGDHISFLDIDGRVEAVGWHSTRIASIEDGYSYIVPNTDVLSSALKNLSRREYVPIKVDLQFPEGVTTEGEMRKFTNDIGVITNNVTHGVAIGPPSVQIQFDGLNPTVKIKAYIDGRVEQNCDELKASLMREIVKKVEDPNLVVVNTVPVKVIEDNEEEEVEEREWFGA